ncbi:hypothetical protein Acr_01g0003230 [Actinidia rufa]|uniref:Uncharacterized protein n=1 Tax=Actinidia rufa TaxID=165716 RepID=A0A7J0E1Z9_9ERIC|nr:hypothetical protein Acr_01g0003230 [Actinidia rufa]
MDMTDRFQQSPYRRQRNDVEAGTGRSSNYGEGSSSGPFEIYRTKDASVHRLRRWRGILNQSKQENIIELMENLLDTFLKGDFSVTGHWGVLQQCRQCGEATLMARGSDGIGVRGRTTLVACGGKAGGLQGQR